MLQFDEKVYLSHTYMCKATTITTITTTTTGFPFLLYANFLPFDLSLCKNYSEVQQYNAGPCLTFTYRRGENIFLKWGPSAYLGLKLFSYFIEDIFPLIHKSKFCYQQASQWNISLKKLLVNHGLNLPQRLNGAIPSRKYSTKTPANFKTSMYVLTGIYDLQ